MLGSEHRGAGTGEVSGRRAAGPADARGRRAAAAAAKRGHRTAGPAEVWAARAWNVFNEGRPFSVVYPVLVLLATVPVGLAPDGSILLALAGALALSAVLACFTFPLRGRLLLWLAL